VETFEDRLRRFLFGSPNEIFVTILNSISNFTLPQLRAASNAELYKLALLGAHSAMQTISEQIYGQHGVDATTFYLTNFVDGDGEDTQFSTIARELHAYRNVHAHRWSSRSNHAVGLDTNDRRGWWRDDEGLHINPVTFMTCFSAGFRADSPMWRMPRELDPLMRLIQKYKYLRQWLELEEDSAAFGRIRALEQCADVDVANGLEPGTQESVLQHFGFHVGAA
jgi:hypothetical protein